MMFDEELNGERDPELERLGRLVDELRTEIDEHKRAEELFHRFFHTSLDMLCIAGFDGYFRRLNPAWERTLGFSVDELYSHPFLEFVHPDDRSATTAEMEKISKGNATISFENRYRCEDGSYKWLLWNAAPLVEKQIIYAAARDITERKQAEESIRKLQQAAEAANRSKSDFLAQMSHEIRTPMNAIVGMADLLWETPLNAEQRQYVRIFRQAGTNLTDLLNDLLDISKIESGNVELEEIDFDLREVVDRVCELLAVRAHAKGLELVCRIMPGAGTELRGDPTRLRQVLTNLVGNAIKFTEKGEVILRVQRELEAAAPEHLQFVVSDTGIGIPAEKLSQVFERFTQVDTSTTRRYGGSGLGLAIAKYLVDLMGGRIWVESRVGLGSSFFFTARFRVARDLPERPAKLPFHLNGLRTLVVDDNATNRLILAETLTGWGALLTTADNGEEALAELLRASEAGEPYGLVLLDGRMPGMNGFQLAEQINQHPAITAMTVLMLKSDDRAGDAERCRRLGIAAYLVKPIQRSELIAAIEVSMRQTRNQSDLLSTQGDLYRPANPLPSRMLLVDDSEENVFLIQSYLKESGCFLEVAENGELALQKFQSGSYDVVLMDLQMPTMDGYTATRRIRDLERKQHATPTPIIALTAYTQQKAIEQAREAGCTAYLTKPIRRKTLLEELEKYGEPAHEPSSDVNLAERFQLDIDPRVQAMLPKYLEARRKDIEMLLAAVDVADYKGIRDLAHRMRGSGAGYGLSRLTVIGERLESAAESGDAQSIREHVNTLSRYLDAIERHSGPQ